MNEDETPVPGRISHLLSRLGLTGWVGMFSFLVFSGWVLITLLLRSTSSARYLFLRDVHGLLSRFGLSVAIIMLGIAVYIGLIRHADVTSWFRRMTYTIFVFMLLQGGIGGIMYLMGGRAGQDVHIIYGYGVVLSLPFFIFVEVTAKKRPAMGSYIWAFTMLAAIIVRCITTGPPT